MRIERDSRITVKPRAFEELLQRQHIQYHNAHWELRNPIGVFNVTFHNVMESFREVLDELDTLLSKQVFREIPPTKKWDETLMRRQENLVSR